MVTDQPPLEFFSWHRPKGRYEWRTSQVLGPDNQAPLDDADRKETRFLMPKEGDQLLHTHYDPLKDTPTLYLEFAALDGSEASFATFASDYGPLGVGVLTADSGAVQLFEPLCRWRLAHAGLQHAVEVLRAGQNSDAATLEQWFTRTPNGVRYQRDFGRGRVGGGWVTIEDQLRPYVWRWLAKAPSDAEALTRVALAWVQEQVNRALNGDPHLHHLTKASPRVVFDQDRQQMTIRVVPETLLGAIWLQCARALALRPTFKACEHCGRWFEVSAETRRKNSKYCSSRCKVARYRAKHPEY